MKTERNLERAKTTRRIIGDEKFDFQGIKRESQFPRRNDDEGPMSLASGEFEGCKEKEDFRFSPENCRQFVNGKSVRTPEIKLIIFLVTKVPKFSI